MKLLAFLFRAESLLRVCALVAGLGSSTKDICNFKLRVRQQITEKAGVYFITFTCKNWQPLISRTRSYDFVYQWFDYLKLRENYVSGYVIMPNHIHALIGFLKTEKSINKIIGDGKRFIAYELIKRD